MRWRDVRFEKPTAADADSDRYIFQKLTGGRYTAWHWDSLADCIAWCPTSELPAFDRVPDPPEGWRFVEKGEAFDKRARFWNKLFKTFDVQTLGCYMAGNIYIVPIIPIDPPAPPEGYKVATDSDSYDGMIFWCPIDRKWKPVPATSGRKIEPGWYAVPTKPQYRPFANAKEFEPYRDKWWMYKDDPTLRPPAAYNGTCHAANRWDVSFERKIFEDGSPFGVKVIPFQP
jgi:hypothetical protein